MGLSCIFQNLNGQNNPNNSQALTDREKQIVAISAFTAKGDQAGLSAALHDGLDAGLTINEAKEILIHLYAYCGFPRSLNGLSTLQAVLEQRKQNAIEDKVGKEASPLPTNKTKEELGSDVLVQLVGTSEATGVRQFAPLVDAFLKAHLFGDIFGRDVLDFQSREIATISALASMQDTESQLGSHLKVAQNIGMTHEQLKDIALEIAIKIGWQEGQIIKKKMKKYGS
ncbi:MAG: carboxymuconolactone decarboxylase family protein [Bacteroidia bacterium]|nr:carboxymuconolactone decarboxylase family protein [Bacteroidia bacterium]